MVFVYHFLQMIAVIEIGEVDLIETEITTERTGQLATGERRIPVVSS